MSKIYTSSEQLIGGTPLLDKSNASGVVKARYGTNYPGDTYSNSIHANGTARKTEGVFLNGKAWLNKTQVDPYTHGFTGKPEILTLETTGDFPVGFLAYYGMRDDSQNGNYEIMGETIFYSAPLSDENRAWGAEPCDPDLRMKLPMAVISALVVILGFWSEPLVTFIRSLVP